MILKLLLALLSHVKISRSYACRYFSLSVFFIATMLTACSTSNQLKSHTSQNKVVAHRGAWKHTGAPQNSMASLKAAIKLGCAGSEADVHLTADSKVVVNHDPQFKGIDIQSNTLATLRQHSLENGEKLPQLLDFLKEIISQNRTKLVIEIKPSQRGVEWAMQTVRAVLECVRQFKADDHVLYISFDYEMCRELKRLQPKAHVQYLNGDKSPPELEKDGIDGLDYHYSVYQIHPEYVEQAKKSGLVLNAWTVNDGAEIDRLLGLGFDFITTDEPELALKRGIESPAAFGWKLVWSEEFAGAGLPDKDKWNYDVGGHGWGNNERQFYTEGDTANALVKNGSLHIIARNDGVGERKYTSARLVTKGKASWQYGRVEMRAKLPRGIGLWPAFWMLGANIDSIGWPSCGEIDIMEHVGYKPEVVLGTVHTNAFNHSIGTQVGEEVEISGPYSRFHMFAVEWSEEKIVFFVDNKKHFEFKNLHKTNAEWPFDAPFFIVLNLAVGGNLGGVKGIDESAFPAIYEIDFVRVYQR